ncbi:MAG: hypothetical protein OXQ31_05145 [Spirochaetaceae bacterium]|nr:hypothetical protein [Spirochaetaceae bacterium]
MEQKDIRASGWLFAIRNRWYARLVTRTPLGSLMILAVTVIGLWLLAVGVELTRFTSTAATVQGRELRGRAPLAVLESVGRDGEVLWRLSDDQGAPRTARLVDWRRAEGESADFVVLIADAEVGTTGNATVDFPDGVETIAQRLRGRVLGRVVEQ